MTAKTVAHVVVDELTAAGTDIAFGIPGGVISPVFDALLDRPGVRLIVARHETSAVFMAMGYCYATGNPGLVLTTAGPGFSNGLTGLAAAAAESLPIILVSGEVPKSAFGRGALQEGTAYFGSAVALARHLCKFAAQIGLVSTAPSIARKALATALSGRRGPVCLTLPLDIGRSEASGSEVRGRVSSRFEVDEDACRAAVAALERAKRPVMLLGNGARGVYARRVARNLAERLMIPVMVTTKGKGVFPEDHALYLGVFGLGGHENAIAHLRAEQPDVVLVCGSALNDLTTNAWSPLLQATTTQIQIDIDAAQIGRNYRTDLAILGPVDLALSRMLEYAHQTDRAGELVALRDAPESQLQLPVQEQASPPGQAPAPQPTASAPMSMQQVLTVLAAELPPDTVFVCDIGEFLTVAVNALRVREGGDFIVCLGLGSMGSGIGAAIGYQLAAPARRVVCVAGDGGMLMYGNELASAVKYHAAVTFCVLNDHRYNMCHHGHLEVYDRTPDLTCTPVDFAAWSRALGAEGEVVTTRAELASALQRQLVGPRVLDIRFDPDIRAGHNQRNAALRHFIGES